MKALIKDIDWENRSRKEFGDVEGLAISIRKYGVLHPLVVSKSTDGKHKYKLVAGERRIRACLFNGIEEVPINLKENLNEMQLKEIELEENVHRKELHWSERGEIIRQLDELKRKIYGSATASRYGDKGEKWGLQDTADSLGITAGMVSKSITMANYIKSDPTLLKKVGHLPQTAARKVIEQMRKEKFLQTRVDSGEIKVKVDLRHGDCIQLIDELEDGSVNLVVTDPPYGAEIAEFGGDGGRYSYTHDELGKESNVSNHDHMIGIYKSLFPKMYNKMSDGAYFFILIGDPHWFVEVSDILESAKFKVYPTDLVWDKGRPVSPNYGTTFRRSHTLIIYGVKEPHTRELRTSMRDVLQFDMEAPQSRAHPLQISSGLLTCLIDQASFPGELVLDPFAGSGSTLISAKKLSRNAVGFELEHGNYLRALEHIEKELKNVK